MRQRCLNPNAKGYQDYGGRGITVCAAWIESFEAFLADMGPRPSTAHTIDRIDNDGHYEPCNCRWATMKEQRANQRFGIKRPRKKPAVRRPTCMRGHPLSGDNLYHAKDGSSRCKICKRAHTSRRKKSLAKKRTLCNSLTSQGGTC